jgi:hypothetical protein
VLLSQACFLVFLVFLSFFYLINEDFLPNYQGGYVSPTNLTKLAPLKFDGGGHIW